MLLFILVVAIRYALPAHPAYIPERQLGLSDDMTFPQRFKNTVMSVVYKVLFYGEATQYSFLQAMHNIAPDTSIVELSGRAELWIICMDFVLDFPRPLHPNVVLISPPTVGRQDAAKVR